MQSTRPRVLLITPLKWHLERAVFHGAVDYAHQLTNWRLTCRTECNPAEQGKMGLSGVLSMTPDRRAFDLARHAGIPLVLVGCVSDDAQVSAVSVDERAIGAMAAEYLAGLGLKHYAYVGVGTWTYGQNRCEGFAGVVEAMGFAPVERFVEFKYNALRRARFERELAAMLLKLPLPCGVLTLNDAIGAVVVEISQRVGLRVPDDIAVVGVDDDRLICEMSEVPLSSVAQPLVAIGYEGARLLHRHIEQPGTPATTVLLPPQRMVPRASSDLLALDDPDVVAALRLINEHISEPINVAWLMSRLPVARRSLERRFRRVVGRSILDQIHHARLERVKELLTHSDLGLELVAMRSGFTSTRWMADSFRREVGMTPGRYRAQSRNGP